MALITVTPQVADYLTDTSSYETCVASKLVELDQLRQDGHLTEAEHDSLRADAIEDEVDDTEHDGCG